MKKIKIKSLIVMTGFALLMSCAPMTGTQSNNSQATKEEQTTGKKVEIMDARKKVSVPFKPQRVVALDSRSFETLEAWGIPLVAAPKDVMPKDSSYVKDQGVINIGNHREPNFEAMVAQNPDLVIIGQRFTDYYEDIKKLLPNAAVIDLTVDVSEKATQPGENLVKGLTDSSMVLGQIFGKEKEAKGLMDQFAATMKETKAAYPKEKTVMAVIVSGGKIGYAAPKTGRVFGPLYEVFGWKPALEVANTTTDHQGDEVSVEAIAEANPDILVVLDRDAGTSSAEKSQAAKDVIENSAPLAKTKAVLNGKIVYAPNDMYTNESIQTYMELFQALRKAF